MAYDPFGSINGGAQSEAQGVCAQLDTLIPTLDNPYEAAVLQLLCALLQKGSGMPARDIPNPLPVIIDSGGGGSVASSAFEERHSVLVTSTIAVAANPDRKGGWVRNLSDVDFYVSFSGTAVMTKPTLLNPGATLSFSGNGWLYVGAVSVIHGSTGAKILEVVEM